MKTDSKEPINLTSMLDGLRRTGTDKWIARCPAHDDRSPSLSIARANDRWLIHCFGGCLPIEIMGALDLELADLFDDRMYRVRGDRQRPKISAVEKIKLIEHEIAVACLLASDFERDGEISSENTSRLAQAVARIGTARHA